jgi:CDGSH-type Zn-finger protein
MFIFKGKNKVKKPIIEPTINGPNRVLNLKKFINSRGETIETQPEMYLCRCGGSSHKPFCDRTHRKIGFKSDKSPDRVPDRHHLFLKGRKSLGYILMETMPIKRLLQ